MERRVFAVACVRFHYADKVPLVAQHVGQQTFVRACPRQSDAVERAHDSVHLAVSYSRLECAEVDIARALLVEERRYAVTVAFLIVEREVLGHDYDADALYALDFRREHKSREHAVLAVIFPVSAAVGVSVDIRTRRPYKVEVAVHRFVSHGVADAFHKLDVPGSRHDDGRRESVLGRANARRSVGRSAAGRADALSRREIAETDRDHKVLFFERHLVEKVIPLRIVVFEILHHGEAELAVGRGYLAVHGQLVAFRDFDRVPVLHVADHYIVDAFERDRRRRESAFPVVAAEVRYSLIVLSAFVQVEVGVVETIGYLFFRFRRFGEYLVIGLSDGYLVRHSGVAGRVHPRLLLGGEVLARKNVV